MRCASAPDGAEKINMMIVTGNNAVPDRSADHPLATCNSYAIRKNVTPSAP